MAVGRCMEGECGGLSFDERLMRVRVYDCLFDFFYILISGFMIFICVYKFSSGSVKSVILGL